MYRQSSIWGTICLAVLSLSSPCRAVPILTAAELYSDWSQPANVSSPPFNFAGTVGVSLTLNASQQVSSIADLGSFQSFGVDATVTYADSVGIDVGESFGGTLAQRVNDEIGDWDDAGIIAESGDAALNVDFNGPSDSAVLFALPGQGFSTLIVAEDAGFDPFLMAWCLDSVCTGGPTVLFNGFTPGATAGLLARPDFGAGDTGLDVDQAFVFTFEHPITGYLGFERLDNPGGEILELDFVGGSTAVPEPGTLLLVGTGLFGLAAWHRRRRRT